VNNTATKGVADRLFTSFKTHLALKLSLPKSSQREQKLSTYLFFLGKVPIQDENSLNHMGMRTGRPIQ
jgi:hypothetical protein